MRQSTGGQSPGRAHPAMETFTLPYLAYPAMATENEKY